MRPTLRHLLFGQTPFSPRSLFAAGEVGAWYEPGSLDTLYQTSNGTTPVTAGEQPVGLVLDKSKGLALGPELVTNGDFSGGSTGWTQATPTRASYDFTGGKLRMANDHSKGSTVGYSTVTTLANIVSGKTYIISLDILAKSGSLLTIAASDLSSGSSPTTILSQNFPVGNANKTYWTATVSRAYLVLQIATAADGIYYDFDNISVRELPGSHALQSSSTLRPTYKTSPSRLSFDADPDALTITFPSAPGNLTLAYGVSGGEPVINYPVNISGTTYTIDPSVIGTFGPELVTNGGFDADSGWTKGSGWTISGGVASFSGATGASLTQNINFLSGKTYQIIFDLVSGSLTGVSLFGGGANASAAISGAGQKIVYITTTANRTGVGFNTAGGTTAVIDNISVKELTGAAAQNTGLVIVNRALTAAETVKLTQYLKARS